jgi:hypothetical protein
VPLALADGGGLKLGKPVGGVEGPCCAADWDPDCGACWAPNPPVDVGIAAWVGAWLDG